MEVGRLLIPRERVRSQVALAGCARRFGLSERIRVPAAVRPAQGLRSVGLAGQMWLVGLRLARRHDVPARFVRAARTGLRLGLVRLGRGCGPACSTGFAGPPASNWPRVRGSPACARPTRTIGRRERRTKGGAGHGVAQACRVGPVSVTVRSLLDRWARQNGSASSPPSRSAMMAVACPSGCPRT